MTSVYYEIVDKQIYKPITDDINDYIKVGDEVKVKIKANLLSIKLFQSIKND